VVRHWHRLPRGGGAHPCRQPMSGWMGSEHLMELWVSLFSAGGLDLMAFRGTIPNQMILCFYDLCSLIYLKASTTKGEE